MMPLCVPFVCSTLGIVLNWIADAITDHSQSAKDIDLYFKTQLMWNTLAPERWYLFYRMG